MDGKSTVAGRAASPHSVGGMAPAMDQNDARRVPPAHARAFPAVALEAGGPCNGPPGLRVHDHPNYHGAFVHCPDGHAIEAVCPEPEDS